MEEKTRKQEMFVNHYVSFFCVSQMFCTTRLVSSK